MRRHKFDLSSTEITQQSLASFDCVVLCTAHDDFNYDFIAENSSLIIDTRGRFDKEKENVVRA